jgi:hypothetical protein
MAVSVSASAHPLPDPATFLVRYRESIAMHGLLLTSGQRAVAYMHASPRRLPHCMLCNLCRPPCSLALIIQPIASAFPQAPIHITAPALSKRREPTPSPPSACSTSTCVPPPDGPFRPRRSSARCSSSSPLCPQASVRSLTPSPHSLPLVETLPSIQPRHRSAACGTRHTHTYTHTHTHA